MRTISASGLRVIAPITVNQMKNNDMQRGSWGYVGFRVEGLGSRVEDLGFQVEGGKHAGMGVSRHRGILKLKRICREYGCHMGILLWEYTCTILRK